LSAPFTAETVRAMPGLEAFIVDATATGPTVSRLERARPVTTTTLLDTLAGRGYEIIVVPGARAYAWRAEPGGPMRVVATPCGVAERTQPVYDGIRQGGV